MHNYFFLSEKHRLQQVENETTHESTGTEDEPSRNYNNDNITDHGHGLTQQTIPYSPPLSSPPVLISNSTTRDQNEKRPAPEVSMAALDNDQSPSYYQDRILRKQIQQVPAGKRALKNFSFALRRSYSAAEALSPSTATTLDTGSQLCTSTPLTDYPYVLHTFEVLGKDQAQASSLPNIRRFSRHYANFDFAPNPGPSAGMKPFATGQDSPSHIDYTNIGTVNFNKLDYELSYSYPNKRRVVQFFPDSVPHKESGGEFSDEDHPSNWVPSSQFAKSPGSKSPTVHKESNGILPPVKSQNTPRHKPKPPIPPPKKTTRPPYGHNGGNADGQKYTGLLLSTRESVHKYTSLQKKATELHELTTSHDADAERAYPDEWYNN